MDPLSVSSLRLRAVTRCLSPRCLGHSSSPRLPSPLIPTSRSGGEPGVVTRGETILPMVQLLRASGRQVENKQRGFGWNKPNLAQLKSLQTVKLGFIVP